MSDAPLIVIPPGLENDPDIYAAVKSLALTAIENAKDLLTTGSPPIQMQVVRMLLPSVTKSLQSQSSDDDDELKREVADMYGAIRDAITPTQPVMP